MEGGNRSRREAGKNTEIRNGKQEGVCYRFDDARKEGQRRRLTEHEKGGKP